MIDVKAVQGRHFPPVRQTYSQKDVILYALALGYGSDPVDPAQLRYVFEGGLQVVPTFANVLCHPGFWISDPVLGIDAARAVHGEHHVSFHKPLPAAGTVRAQTRVLGLEDKGVDKGALLVVERLLCDDASGVLLARIEQHTLLRGDGGFSAASPSVDKTSVRAPAMDRPPDHVLDLATLPQAALLYRLSADMNPLHADPNAAGSAGFSRPILHGLCTFGIVCRAVLEACADGDPSRLGSLGGRFSAPVFPGETLRTEIWHSETRDGVQKLRVRCFSVQRNCVVFTNGIATVIS
ncbi:MAG: MaoC family dehydratase N-terminal domain-containing protein [Proteobacteria bacterium]|jgi:acyl dehydratase|nr:MaoC family dehydratase N-terminal domain-containing protein [Pseudomonadota bacterium]